MAIIRANNNTLSSVTELPTAIATGSLVKLYSSASSSSESQLILDSTYINSTYDNYKIIMGYTVDTDGTRMDAQFYVGGTKNTSANYFWHRDRQHDAVDNYDTDAATSMQLAHSYGNATGETCNLVLDLLNVNSTTVATTICGFSLGGNTDTHSYGFTVTAGQDNSGYSSAVNGIEFFPHQGTAKFLHFTLYGYTK